MRDSKKGRHQRILIAGYEVGGQMQLLAETMRSKGYDAHSVAFNSDFRGFTNDYQIKSSKLPLQRFLFSMKAIYHYDVFHFFWGISLLDFWKFHSLDLPLLRKLNKRIVVHFRGTDLVNVHYYQHLNNLAIGLPTKEIAKTRPDQKIKLERWRKYAHYLLVSTPDLLRIVPEALLYQQVVDIKVLQKIGNDITNSAFRVAHAPTRRNAKGTDIIIRAIENLQKNSYPIELDLIENQPPEEVLKRFSKCDVGIDQLLSGWYGKAGVELMALGKPVLCYIEPELMQYRPDLPIVNVTPATLNLELEKLILDKTLRTELGIQSQQYAARYHDVEKIADQLLQLYGFTETSNVREHIDDASMW